LIDRNQSLIDSNITSVHDYAVMGNRKITYVKGDLKNILFKEVCLIQRPELSSWTSDWIKPFPNKAKITNGKYLWTSNKSQGSLGNNVAKRRIL